MSHTHTHTLRTTIYFSTRVLVFSKIAHVDSKNDPLHTDIEQEAHFLFLIFNISYIDILSFIVQALHTLYIPHPQQIF